jgi:hypothetical protein
MESKEPMSLDLIAASPIYSIPAFVLFMVFAWLITRQG